MQKSPSRTLSAISAVALAFTTLAVTVLVATPAAAHFISWDSVDNGEIRYEDHTQWDDARTTAINSWNTVGSVDFKPDSITTIADLEIQDYSSADGRCGYASTAIGANHANLNNYYFNGYSSSQRRACTSHELGHHLGLGHSYTTEVMDSCPPCNTGIYWVPKSHDKADYNILWS